jgi:DNA adenine methylase
MIAPRRARRARPTRGTPVAVPVPPLKWAGGKRWQVRHLLPLWRPHAVRRLVEPFCGGLAVTLGLMPQRALLSDVNPHLINFYRWIGRGLTIRIPMRNEKDLYYAHRARFNALLADGEGTTHEAAALFYFLNRTGYNGLCRFNASGAFNVPFGRYRTIPYARSFPAHTRVFSAWRFACGDFEAIDLAPDDFVYADPPYDVPFTSYSQGGFGWDDQVRAARWLARHRGPVVLSNQATPRIVELYRSLGFTLTYLEAPRRISRTGDRTPAREVVALRNF